MIDTKLSTDAWWNVARNSSGIFLVQFSFWVATELFIILTLICIYSQRLYYKLSNIIIHYFKINFCSFASQLQIMSYNYSIKHKQFFAIMMLVIYCFVATPIQLWHDHNYSNIESSFNSDKKNQVSESKSAGSIVEENCKICSHQYSSYEAGAVVLLKTPLNISSPNNSVYYNFLPLSPVFNFTNKGPPLNG